MHITVAYTDNGPRIIPNIRVPRKAELFLVVPLAGSLFGMTTSGTRWQTSMRDCIRLQCGFLLSLLNDNVRLTGQKNMSAPKAGHRGPETSPAFPHPQLPRGQPARGWWPREEDLDNLATII